MDPLILSRIQFAVNISFHILFPAITMALAWVLVFFRFRWIRTRQQEWLSAYRFWTKVFALTFAMGVVSGVTMSFQFGTNWPGFMETTGNISGPLLGYEVLTAFFLEAAFLGIMLFGHDRVSNRVHLFSAFMVAFGTTLSAFWILALNSWMQTPQGYSIDADGIFHVTSWAEVIFNPSFPYRFAHMMLASGLTVAFLLCGLSAWQVIKGVATAATDKVMKFGLILAAVLIPIQIFVGDLHGLNTLEHQPAKVAAMEAAWETEKGTPLVLFGIPDETQRTNHFEISIPSGAALILTHEMDGEIKGLNDFDEHPPVAPLFFGFRIMVGVGMLMLLVSWYGYWRFRKANGNAQKLPKPLLYTLAGMTFSGWVAVLAGWYVTEIGRQPFIVQGLVRTADVVTQTPAAHIGITLVLYLLLYGFLLLAYVSVLKHMAEHPAEALSKPPRGSGEAVAEIAAEDGDVSEAKLNHDSKTGGAA
ncbi:MAG: cytochrome ubiquinol oxidase subunit I [Pseudomonadota bacterium]|nr:cytochrome ubiquinol oxidase subunit I [Pseudomonadota bacterium]